MDAIRTQRFVPPHPPRSAGPVPVWRGFCRRAGAHRRLRLVRAGVRALVHSPQGVRLHRPHPARSGHDPAGAARQCRQLCEARHRQEAARPDDRPRPAELGRGAVARPAADRRRQFRAGGGRRRRSRLRPRRGGGDRELAEGRRGDMAAEATATTMRIIADTLFAGDPRLITKAAMAHITAAMEGVSEARLQALLGLPLMPWSRQDQARADAASASCAIRWTGWSATGCPTAAPDDFLGRADPRAEGEVRTGAKRWRWRSTMPRPSISPATRPPPTRSPGRSSCCPSSRSCRSEAAAEARDGAGRWARTMPGLPERLPLLRRILEESMRLYPPVPRFDRQAVAADRIGEVEVAPGDIVSIWPWLLHRHRASVGRSRRLRSRPLRRRRQGDAPPLPVSALRRRPAPVRRRALRHDRGADRAGALAEPLAVRADSRAARCGPRGWSRCGRPAACRSKSVLLPADIDRRRSCGRRRCPRSGSRDDARASPASWRC